MQHALELHPDSLSPVVSGIDVEVIAGRGMLQLRYRVTGSIEEMSLPPMTSPARTDELWKQTCFEAFVGSAGEDAYVELNFAPSTQWAAYRFDFYRSGMRDAEQEAPKIETDATGGRCELRAMIRLPGNGPWRLGLAAVIEAKDGRKSYWALAHPPGDPDFHHETCFALELPAADEP